jgi:hypothetical protein
VHVLRPAHRLMTPSTESRARTYEAPIHRVGHGFGSTRQVSGSGRLGTGRGSLGLQTRRNPLPDPRFGGSLRVRIIRLFSTILGLSSTVSRVGDCMEKLDLQFNSSGTETGCYVTGFKAGECSPCMSRTN